MRKLIEKIKYLEIIIKEKLKNMNITIKILENSEMNKAKIVIFKKRKVDRVFIIEEISYRQVMIKENNEIIENAIHIENLGKWLYNLYQPIEVLYVFYGGKHKGKILTKEQVEKIAIGKTDLVRLSRFNREFLKKNDKQPIVKGYLGPMFEKIDYGKIYLRFETQEIYDMLSA